MASKVTIEVDGDEFHCDRGELVRQSPYFEAMFNGNFIEKDKDRIRIQVGLHITMSHHFSVYY